MLRFSAILAVLGFALYHSEQKSTRIWIVGCMALTAMAILTALCLGDLSQFEGFEEIWGSL